jgi:hypothetical protein
MKNKGKYKPPAVARISGELELKYNPKTDMHKNSVKYSEVDPTTGLIISPTL